MIELADLPALYGGMPVFVAVVAADRRVLYFNQAAGALFDLSVGEPMPELPEETEALPQARADGAVTFNVLWKGDWHQVTRFDLLAAGKTALVFAGLDYAEVKRSEENLIAEVLRDPMTGIFNQKAGLYYLQKFAGQLSDDNYKFTVCYMDIENLKALNDQFGTEAGDECIQTVAQIINSSIRQTDVFARMGGDEFMLIFPKCPYRVVENIMETVERKLEVVNAALEANEDKASQLRYGISYGILEVHEGMDPNPEKIVRAVEKEMQYMRDEGL